MITAGEKKHWSTGSNIGHVNYTVGQKERKSLHGFSKVSLFG